MGPKMSNKIHIEVARVIDISSWSPVTKGIALALVSTALFTAVGVSAYKYGEANVVSNVEYIKIVYAMAIGYLLFSEVPNQLALIGVALLFLSVLVPRFIVKRAKQPC